jgi:hypothetical protein
LSFQNSSFEEELLLLLLLLFNELERLSWIQKKDIIGGPPEK